MLGAAVGDIVGSVYEWHNIKTKEFPLFGKNCRFTDDTVMTFAVASAFLKAEPASEALFIKTLTGEMQRLGREYPNAGYGGRFSAWLESAAPQPYNSWGNGSAMRVSPAAYAARSLEQAELFAGLTAMPSHNHPEGIKGAQAAAAATFLALQKKPKAQIREYLASRFGYDLDFTLDDIRPAYRFDVSCQGTVPQAVCAFLEAEGFEDAVRNAISIGGDSDTLAAITGGIAGAYYGIPAEIEQKALSYLTAGLAGIYEDFTNNIVSQRRWEM